jgi:hypothetical protein
LKTWIAAVALGLALPGAVSAATFSGSWNVSGSALSDPGLVVAASGSPSFSFDLDSGQSTSFDLFRIWSPEADVGSDDMAPRSLDVGFDLSSHGAGGSVAGTTAGHKFLGFQWGSVDWDQPLDIDVGHGTLSVALADTGFNTGFFGLLKGEDFGSNVKATFSYTAPAPVPLPAGLGLIAAACGALGLAGVRRRAG